MLITSSNSSSSLLVVKRWIVGVKYYGDVLVVSLSLISTEC